jgi:hypothetical protein
MPKKVIPNPNGANSTTSDPRQQVCWDLYVENNFENAYQCAIKAGYTKSASKRITTVDWFSERMEKLRRKDMLSNAEKVLDKTLKYSTESAEGKPIVDLLRVQTDVAKHVTETLGKNLGYSKRNELTGKDGERIEVPIYGGKSQDTGHNSDQEDISAPKEN